MPYSCDNCNHEFKRPWMLKRHLNRKNPCIQVEIEITSNIIPKSSLNHPPIIHQSSLSKNIDNDQKSNNNLVSADISTPFQCKYCKNVFAIKNSLYKHINELRCKKIPTSKLNQLVQKQNNKHIQLYRENNMVMSTGNNNTKNINNGTVNNTLSIINNNTINNIEIKINPMGKEDTSFLTQEDKKRILERMYNSLPELVKTIHNHPSNRNFFLPNTNKNIVACLNNDNEIEYNDYNSICKQILQDNVDRLDELFNELETEVNDSIRNRLERVFKKVEDGKLDTKYLKDIKLYILNNSKRNKDEILNYIENIENIKV